MAINNVTGAQSIIKAGVCTSSTRPPSPFVGQMIFETDTSLLKVWLGSAWSIGTFHSVTFVFEYLVIAGGGGSFSGGGGAGGYRTSVVGELSGANSVAEPIQRIGIGTHSVIVGAGGVSQGDGSNSSFFGITSIGGGASVLATAGGNLGRTGGSGGGGARVGAGSNMAGGAGTAGQGFAGGTANSTSAGVYIGGGGGGAGAVGGSSSGTVAGSGGAGITSSINGTPTIRGGGGGSTANGAGSPGGAGGGGNGEYAPTAAQNGAPNTGGGAGSFYSVGGVGLGGSGVVIIRYLTTDALGLSITGGTITTSGPHTIHTFTASGNLVVA